MPFPDTPLCPRQAEAPPRSLGAQPCQPFPAGQLVLSSLSGQIRAAVTRMTHATWGMMEVPSPARSSPEGVHSEVSVCWGLHAHTAPQTIPTQAPCKFWRKDHPSQIWSSTQHGVYCDIRLWLHGSFVLSFPLTVPLPYAILRYSVSWWTLSPPLIKTEPQKRMKDLHSQKCFLSGTFSWVAKRNYLMEFQRPQPGREGL